MKPVLLIVDDEKSTRTVLSAALEDSYEVFAAANGKADVTVEGGDSLTAGADNEIKVICTAENGEQSNGKLSGKFDFGGHRKLVIDKSQKNGEQCTAGDETQIAVNF